MENVVKNWPNLNPRQRGQVRQDVAAILANVNTQEALYVREKIASVVNEVFSRVSFI
jgi:3-methyladenine DNA glycosylase AlkC